MAAKFVKGNYLLTKFYLENIPTIHSLPKWMRNPDTLKDLVAEKSCEKEYFDLAVTKSTAVKYNQSYDNMKAEMRHLHSKDQDMLSYKSTLCLLFFLRFLCIISACNGDLTSTLLLSSLQFLFAPYSLFVSATLALALAPPIYISHYLSFLSIQWVTSTLLLQLPTSLTAGCSWAVPYLHLPIGPLFVSLFFLADQALCLYCHLLTPSRSFTLRKTLTHVVWGFLNTKTYTLVLLLHMMHARVSIPVWIWALDATLGVTDKMAKTISGLGMHWMELFYQQHRMAHLPKVYEHAHKLHHYLQGTLAFDAHIYGNGMPEEFFFLLLELSAGVCFGLTPATLNRLVLQFSVDNKFGHTQKPKDTCGDNFHADHHLIHAKNFGIYNCLMDMYFKTASYSNSYLIQPALYCPGEGVTGIFRVEKTEQGENVVFTFTPAIDGEGDFN